MTYFMYEGKEEEEEECNEIKNTGEVANMIGKVVKPKA